MEKHIDYDRANDPESTVTFQEYLQHEMSISGLSWKIEKKCKKLLVFGICNSIATAVLAVAVVILLVR